MKASRKVNRGSFINRISGGGTSQPVGGGGKAAPESDHDLISPPEPAGGAKPDDRDR